VIAGAGPAGLTAAHELLERTDVVPLVFEASSEIGGISRTVRHAGRRMDLGGHRFFSRSDRVMDWWLRVLPLQRLDGARPEIAYQQQARTIAVPADGPDPEREDDVMLLRERRSRIFFRGRLFDYPLRLTPATLARLGPVATTRILASYLRAAAFPRPEEQSLEDFFVNRFGRELYETFFRDYTEKVWGRPCREIDASWGRQRVKGLSIAGALRDGLARLGRTALAPVWHARGDPRQRGTETSLIEQFLYPKLGPGQLWERVADGVRAKDGRVTLERAVVGLETEGARVTAAWVQDARTGDAWREEADFFGATMPVPHLVRSLGDVAPAPVRRVAEALPFRALVTVGLLLRTGDLALREGGRPLRDNWIYVQEPGFRLGRIQLFHNWSPWMVAGPDDAFLGLEYFCDAGDDLWGLSDEKLARFAAEELAGLGLVRDPARVRDACVVRTERAYPAYFGAYESFPLVRAWLDRFENLFLVGRNGMHRYNNQDHSMLTAMAAVDAIAAGSTDKAPLWAVNTEPEYHERR